MKYQLSFRNGVRSSAKALVLLLTLLAGPPIQAQSHSPFRYTSDGHAITITGYDEQFGEDVMIPQSINGLLVSTIGEDAFYGSSITHVSIPNGVTTIRDEAFLECVDLTTVTIPASVSTIGESVFNGCKSMTNVNLGGGITSIPSYTFFGCKSLTAFVIPDGVTNIGTGAFTGCFALGRISIPDSVTSLGDSAFAWTGLTNVVLGNGIKSLPRDVFSDSALTDIVIPGSVTNIGPWAFAGSWELTRVVLSENLIAIGDGAFSACPQMTNIIIPRCVAAIGASAFDTTVLGYVGQGSYIWAAGNVSAYFLGSPPATPAQLAAGTPCHVYYLPENPGWGPTLGGAPTAVWQPVILTFGGQFGVHEGKFGFNIFWVPGRSAAIEAVDSLTESNWVPLGIHSLDTNGNFRFSDSDWANHSSRLYRVRIP